MESTRPRILIVDDDALIRDAMQRWFSFRGFEADAAGDGVEAVEKCAAGRYDVITLDLEMPRMTGVEALPHIRRSLPDVPVVVLTGYLHGFEPSALAEVSEVLLKPLGLGEVEQVVRRVLESEAPA